MHTTLKASGAALTLWLADGPDEVHRVTIANNELERYLPPVDLRGAG